MKVLSLFDGISCARVALERAGILVETYYASEIHEPSIKISKKNYPDIIQIGDVTKISTEEIDKDIWLLIGGSPCQDLSIAGTKKGLNGERSGLFYNFLELRNKIKPSFFILENVASMKEEERKKISEELGVESIMIDAGKLSAQTRKRYFWVGKLEKDGTYSKVEVKQPEDKNIFIKDILESKGEDITDRMNKKVKGTLAHKKTWGNVRNTNQKLKTLTKAGQGICNSGATNILLENGRYKKPTEIECERAQGLPDNYTQGISSTQRYGSLGNAFNVDVVAHILTNLDK